MRFGLLKKHSPGILIVGDSRPISYGMTNNEIIARIARMDDATLVNMILNYPLGTRGTKFANDEAAKRGLKF